MRFTTVDDLRAPIAEVTAGSFGYYRGLLAGSRDVADGSLLFGLEAVVSDGPWVLEEDLSKLNGLLKYSKETSEGSWSVVLSGYQADWTATDQVPERALTNGQISRLGFIDPDLGGRSSRSQVTGHWTHGDTTLHAYAITSDLRLTSNFTYLLDDPVNGDEFQQRDHRSVFGGDLRHTMEGRIANRAATFRFGGDVRYDAIGNVGLYRSSNANPTAVVRQDEVDEYSVGLYGEAEIKLTDRLRAVIGVRGDAFGYDVASDLGANSGDGTDALIAPKVALAWQVSDRLEAYANYGESFHSNDARGATITIDPVTGDPADAVDLLSRARGSELGLRWGGDRLTATAVAYHLNLASELVYVGDAGTTEPNDATERYGVEFSSFWRPTNWLTIDGAATFTHARFSGVVAGQDRIPGSIGTVVAFGASAEFGEGFNATLRLRHFGEAPLVEDGSRRSDATTQVNLGVYYTAGSTRLGLDVLNLFDSEDADITYFYASRLQGEPVDGVEDRHIHPVEPFQVRVSLRQGF